MTGEVRTLGFGATFDTVVTRTASDRVLSLTRHRRSDANPPHAHANHFLCLVLAGSFSEQQSGRWLERRAGCWFAHEAGDPHHDLFGPKGALCLNLHSGEGEGWSGGESGSCSLPARIAADRLAFQLAASCSEELVLSSLAAEIMAEIRPAGHDEGGCAGWIGRIVEAISDEPGRRWRLGELAAIAERHPVRLAQAFRGRTGLSLGAFQRLRRLTSLGLALRHGRRPLAMLAADYGYCDQSHMIFEFRRAFGISPGRYRRGLN